MNWYPFVDPVNMTEAGEVPLTGFVLPVLTLRVTEPPIDPLFVH